MINTSGGVDKATLERLFILEKTRIDVGEDDDTLTVIDSLFTGDAFADGGPGGDPLTLLGQNHFLAAKKAVRF